MGRYKLRFSHSMVHVSAYTTTLCTEERPIKVRYAQHFLHNHLLDCFISFCVASHDTLYSLLSLGTVSERRGSRMRVGLFTTFSHAHAHETAPPTLRRNGSDDEHLFFPATVCSGCSLSTQERKPRGATTYSKGVLCRR